MENDCEGLGLLYTTVDFINTVYLGYIKFIKQQEVKSSTRDNEAIERRGKPEMYEAAGGITRTLFYSKLVS